MSGFTAGAASVTCLNSGTLQLAPPFCKLQDTSLHQMGWLGFGSELGGVTDVEEFTLLPISCEANTFLSDQQRMGCGGHVSIEDLFCSKPKTLRYCLTFKSFVEGIAMGRAP